MAKRIEIDGVFYRMRRGKLVPIPAEWLGKVTTPQTIRKRPSKQIGKLKRADRWRYNTPRHGTGPMFIRYLDEKIHGDLTESG